MRSDKEQRTKTALHHLTPALFTLLAAIAVSANAEETPSIQIDADYPGGNIRLENIEGDDVYITQDLRDTAGWWFYYDFRVRGAAGRKLTFHWTNKTPMAARGPAVSTDGGQTWDWLGKEHVRGDKFSYAFGEDADEVRFGLAMAYQLVDLKRFIEKHNDHPAFQSQVHTTSAKERPVYRMHVGELDDPKHRVLLTCRHHSCEMMASYVLEGILETVLEDDKHGRWLRENVEFLAVPMMDIDGVEDGDQGKNRKPHDHNRDYQGDPIYASVAANKEFVPKWSREKLQIVIDLHCPSVRGGGTNPGSNEQIFFVGGPDEDIWNNTKKLAIFLEAVQTGPLRYETAHNLPWGQGWNTTTADLRRSSTRWAATLPGVEVASTIEFPYATAGGKPVTPAAARAFGRDVALAIRRYLQDNKP